MIVLGIDIGGSGIKGAPVDTETGSFIADRIRIKTPAPSAPDQIAAVIADLAKQFAWSGPIGCGFPAIIKSGTVYSAANVDASWIGCDAATLFGQHTGCLVTMVNDADCAGCAEMRYGAGKDRPGVVFMVTLGTGIGTALFTDGHLVPNVELGHLAIRGKDAEKRASADVRKGEKLSWTAWAERVNEFLHELDRLFSPDLIIVGGGVSKKWDKFAPLLRADAEIVPAEMRNDAGITGAALVAAEAR